MQMQPNTAAKRYGPGPARALMYRNTEVPTNMKTAMITVGAASTYCPVAIWKMVAVGLCTRRVRLARKTPRETHAHPRQTKNRMSSSRSSTDKNESLGGERNAAEGSG